MTKRRWEQPTSQRHTYLDEAGRVIGEAIRQYATHTYVAHAYDQKLGEFAYFADARVAVERACVEIEAVAAIVAAAAAAKTAQADGVDE